MKLSVDQIEECNRVQVRQRNDGTVVTDYAEAFIAGAVFPPITVFQEKGTERFIVADGHHRLQAAQQAKLSSIDVELIEGDETAALEHALGANHRHGLRLNKADRKRAMSLLMTDARIKDKYRTDQDRADLLGVSLRTVRVYKAEWRTATGGNAKEQIAKENAQRYAEQKTRSDLKNNDNTNNGLDSDDAGLHHREPSQQHIQESKKAGLKKPASNMPGLSVVMEGHLRGVTNALEALSRVPYTGEEFVNLVGASRIGPEAKRGIGFACQLADILDV